MTELDKRILKHLLGCEYRGATTTEMARALGLDNPESSGRTIIWRRLKRIEKISIRLKGMPIVITSVKRWLMNYDEFHFNSKQHASKIDVVEEMDRMEAEEELHGTSYERQAEETQTK